MLSPFRKRKFEALFDKMDLNDDGVIDLTDFSRHAERMKAERGWAEDDPRLSGLLDGSRRWWAEMIDRVGVSDKAISRDEFQTFWEWLGNEVMATGSPPAWAVDLCTRTHQALDLSGNGTVDHTEYAVWLRAIGSTADAAEVFKRLDMNADGVVKLDEMMSLFAQFILSEDPADPGNYLMTGGF